MFQSAELTVREYLEMLRRRRWFIAAVAALVTILGTVPSALQESVYTSAAEIQLKSNASVSAFEGVDYENELTRTRDLATDVEVLGSREMQALVEERLGPDGESFSGVVASVTGFSEIVNIRVFASTATGAADAANAYAEVYVEQREEATTNPLLVQAAELRSQAQSLVSRQAEIESQLENILIEPFDAENLRQERASLTAQITEFGRRADELEIDAALRKEATQIVSRAPLQLTPISPKPVRAGVIAFVVGLLVGVCAAVVLEILQDRISTPADMESLDPDAMVLASVPHVDIDLDDPEHELPPSALEAFRYLRTAIRFRSLETPVRSVVITSAMSAEGKTTTAVNLAAAMAESGARVVLVDADMRKPAVHSRLGLSNEVGLSSVIAGECSFQDALHFARPSLAVMTAGPPATNANELLGDDRFAHMVRLIVEQSDLVIIDAPPVLPVADALLVGRATDASLIIGRLGVVRRRELKAAIRRFRDANLSILGLVANDSIKGGKYGGYYGQYGEYGTYGSSTVAAEASEPADEPHVSPVA